MSVKFNLKEFGDALLKKVNGVIEKDLLEDIGKEAEEMIRLRTRLGYGVENDGAARKKLDPLADSYKKQRKGELYFFTTEAGQVVAVDVKTAARAKKKETIKYKVAKKISKKLAKKVLSKTKTTTNVSEQINKQNTTAGKSNLTLTGKMLDALRHKIVGKSVTIYFADAFSEKKAEWAAEGRPDRPKRVFLHLSDLEIKKINLLILKKLKTIFKF